MRSFKRNILLVGLSLALAGGAVIYLYGRSLWAPLVVRIRGRRTVSDVQEVYGLSARERLEPCFMKAGVGESPARLAFLIFKEEKRLELWAADADGWRHIKDYPVLAASGHAGPKLREGDRQVPEGRYGIEYLNPNSSYHLSMKLDYPNEIDLERAREEGRTSPGSDIFIHGKAMSIGCVAIGDTGIEELFDLVSRVGREKVEVLIAPNDLRRGGPVTDMQAAPSWIGAAYADLKTKLAAFPESRKDAQ